MREKMTRREFLKSTGVTAAAIAAAGMLAACGGGGDAPASSSSTPGGSSTPSSSSSSSSSGSSSSSASSGSATFDRPHDMGKGLLICGMQPAANGTIVSGASRSVTQLKTKQIIYVLNIPCGNNSSQDITLKTSDFTAKIDGVAAEVVRMGIKPVEQITIAPGKTQKVSVGVEITADQQKKNGPSEIVLNWNGKKATFTTKELFVAGGAVNVKFS